MAGNYPDAPNDRMAYDRDGTVLFWYRTDNIVYQAPLVDVQAVNDESDSLTNGWGRAFEEVSRHGMIFPQTRSITHVCVIVDTFFARGDYSRVQTTTNSTNGQDGTWTTIATNFPIFPEAVQPNYRTRIQALSAPSIKGIRFMSDQGGGSVTRARIVHLYGTIDAGQTPDRVRIWHPTLDQPLSDTPAYLDWGDVQRTSTATRSFRVKNNSSTKTANNTVISVETLTDANPSVPPQFTMSIGGGAYVPSFEVVTLAPGAITSVISIKRLTPVNAALSVWAPRIVAAPGTMTL